MSLLTFIVHKHTYIIRKEFMWLGVNMLNLSTDLTSQNLHYNAKRFDNDVVVLGWHHTLQNYLVQFIKAEV